MSNTTDPYSTLTGSQQIIMLSIAKFDDGALFDDSLDLPEFKGKWFCNKDMIRKDSAGIHSNLMYYASDKLMNDKEFILSFPSNYSGIAFYISEELKNDRDVVLKFFKILVQESNTIGSTLRCDSSFALELFSSNGISRNFEVSNIERFDLCVRKDKELFLKLIKINPEIFQYADSSIRYDEEIVALVLCIIAGKTILQGYNIGKEHEYYWGSAVIKQNTEVILWMLLSSHKNIYLSTALTNNTIRESRELVSLAIDKCKNASVKLLGLNFINDPCMVMLVLQSSMEHDPTPVFRATNKYEDVATTKFNVRCYTISDMIVCLRAHGW